MDTGAPFAEVIPKPPFAFLLCSLVRENKVKDKRTCRFKKKTAETLKISAAVRTMRSPLVGHHQSECEDFCT